MSFANVDQLGGQHLMGLPMAPENQPQVQGHQAQVPPGALVPVTAPAMARAEVAQVLPAPANLGHLPAATGGGAVQQALGALPGHPAQPEPREVTIHHPQGYDVKIPRSMLPAEIPAGMTLADLTQQVEAKVARGAGLIRDLQQTNRLNNVKATPQNVSDIMWFLQVTAEHKAGSHWEEGAISIDDPNGNIRAFLDSADEPDSNPTEISQYRWNKDPHTNLAYQRDSTHVAAFQTQDNGFPRGIDLYGNARDMDHCLPNGRQTLLYQAMGTQDTGKGPGMPRNMLLLKMENYGCFSKGTQNPERGPVRLENQHDRGAYWGHVKTTIASIWRRLTGQNSGEGTFKERIPPQMEKAYKQLSSWHLFSQTLPSEVRQILQQNHPTNNANGVRVMSANLEQAIAHVRENGNDSGQMRMLQDFKSKFMNDPMLDHQDVRIGNEVVLTTDELERNEPPLGVGHLAQTLTEGHLSAQEMKKMFRDQLIEGYDKQGDGGQESNMEGLSNGFKLDFIDRGNQLMINDHVAAVDPETHNAQRTIEMQLFFQKFGGPTGMESVYDRESALTTTRLLYQFLPGCLHRSMEDPQGKGPWRNCAISYARDGGTSQYGIRRDPNTREIHITYIRQCRIDAIMQTKPNDQLHDFTGNPNTRPTMTQQVEIALPPEPRGPQDARIIEVSCQMDTHD